MNKTFISDISGKKYPISQKVFGESIRYTIMELIRKEHPDFDHTKYISISELSSYREQYISSYLAKSVGHLSKLDKQVIDAISRNSIISDNLSETIYKNTFGGMVADKVASFGGSWRFIIIFICFLLGWITINAFLLLNKGFDPHPFILLNLILSCLAALQAPVIMMSQNRQDAKDRERSREDYMVNLKSEIEVRGLHEKLDHLMMYQQQELIEIQKIQIDMLNDILKGVGKKCRTNPISGSPDKK